MGREKVTQEATGWAASIWIMKAGLASIGELETYYGETWLREALNSGSYHHQSRPWSRIASLAIPDTASVGWAASAISLAHDLEDRW